MAPDSHMGVLKRCLLDLLRELKGYDFPLILCGGFGLYLKQLELQKAGPEYRPLLPGDIWPRPRATEDLDILIRTEILADRGRFARLRLALDVLGYKPIVGAEYMQFSRFLGAGSYVKVDLLTGPVDESLADKLLIKERRVRNRGKSVGLHAHRTEEAIGFQDALKSIAVSGNCMDGQPFGSVVFIPSAFTFIMMKLCAFSDRNQDEDKDFARHHAMDLYRTVSMMSRGDFQQACDAVRSHRDFPAVQHVLRIVADHFSSKSALGLVRLKEHSLFEPNMDAEAFRLALTDMFAEG